LGLTAYGLLAGIATESPVGYGAAAAGAFFLSQAIASDGNVSAPMAALSTDLALRSMVASSIVLGEGPFDDGMGYRTRSGLQLAAGLAGATTGFLWGRSLTLAEAEAIGWGSTTMGFTALGLGSVAGGDAVERRSVAAAGMALGIPMGLWYARRAAYTLSAGDLYAMRVPQALGAAWGGVIGLATGASGPTRALWQTAGLALGTLVGDRTLAKPYNVTTAQAGLMVTGTAVSAILGSVLLANGGPRSDAEQLAYPTTVATLGAILTTALLDLKSGRRVASTGRATATRWSFDPAALLAAATRSPGQHALVRVAF
jgi:hypothetical protein